MDGTDALRAQWIKALREAGAAAVNPFDVALSVVNDEYLARRNYPIESNVERREAVMYLMGLADRDGHERGEPLADSIHDMWFLRGATAERIADALESGRFWAEGAE